MAAEAAILGAALAIALAEQRRADRTGILRHLQAGEDIDIARTAADLGLGRTAAACGGRV